MISIKNKKATKNNKIESFLDALSMHGGEVIRDKDILMLEFLKSIKEDASKINLGCDFKDGLCAGNRSEKKEKPAMMRGRDGCCNSCRNDVGYFDWVPESLVEGISLEWDEETGFLGPNGCRLKPFQKSETCVGFACSHAEKGLTEAEKSFLMSIKYFKL